MLNRNGNLSESATIEVSGRDGTATSPADYTGFPLNVTFGVNSSSASFNVTIINDNILENNETFLIDLKPPRNTNLVCNNIASLNVIIQDDDKDFQAKTQKQKEEDQETRAKQLLILLIVCTALIAVLIAVFIIFLCFVIKWLMKTKI
ncbi:hypothetical protein AC249_AIPGENE12058 [Exaiptasia diaphana]|nr:hypothetical protein AC249_AIPGENE12058 [Exaiptasia diaphana]